MEHYQLTSHNIDIASWGKPANLVRQRQQNSDNKSVFFPSPRLSL